MDVRKKGRGGETKELEGKSSDEGKKKKNEGRQDADVEEAWRRRSRVENSRRRGLRGWRRVGR